MEGYDNGRCTKSEGNIKGRTVRGNHISYNKGSNFVLSYGQLAITSVHHNLGISIKSKNEPTYVERQFGYLLPLYFSAILI